MPSETYSWSRPYQDVSKTYVNGTLTSSSSTTAEIPMTVSTVSGNVPNYKARLREGRLATGLLNASWDRVKFAEWEGSVSYLAPPTDKNVRQEVRRGNHGIAVSLINPPSQAASALNAAKSQIFKKAMNSRRQLQGGVMIGEIRETMQMLRSPAESLQASLFNLLEGYRKLIRVAKRKSSTVAKVNARVRGTYLEHVYGWAPLISDTKAAAEYLAAGIAGENRDVDFIRTEARVETATNITQKQAVGNFRWIVNRKTGRVDRVKILAAMVGYSPHPAVRVMNDLGFSPEDFIPTIYELIPYSFVVDYFSNTGTVLDAWCHRSIQYEWAQTTTVSIRYGIRTMVDDTDAWQRELNHKILGKTVSPGKYHRTLGALTRTGEIRPDLIPEFQFEIPGIRQTFNLVALTNAFEHVSVALAKALR